MLEVDDATRWLSISISLMMSDFCCQKSITFGLLARFFSKVEFVTEKVLRAEMTPTPPP